MRARRSPSPRAEVPRPELNPVEVRFVDPHAMEDHGDFARQRGDRLLVASAPRDPSVAINFAGLLTISVVLRCTTTTMRRCETFAGQPTDSGLKQHRSW